MSDVSESLEDHAGGQRQSQVGSLLSVPLTVLMKIVLEDYEETRWISALMEGHYEKPKGFRLPWFGG